MTTINDFGVPIAGTGEGILHPIVPNKPILRFSCLSDEDTKFIENDLLWGPQGVATINELKLSFNFEDVGQDPPRRRRFFDLLTSLHNQRTNIIIGSHLSDDGTLHDAQYFRDYVVLSHHDKWKKDEWGSAPREYYKTTLFCVKYDKLDLYRDS